MEELARANMLLMFGGGIFQTTGKFSKRHSITLTANGEG